MQYMPANDGQLEFGQGRTCTVALNNASHYILGNKLTTGNNKA